MLERGEAENDIPSPPSSSPMRFVKITRDMDSNTSGPGAPDRFEQMRCDSLQNSSEVVTPLGIKPPSCKWWSGSKSKTDLRSIVNGLIAQSETPAGSPKMAQSQYISHRFHPSCINCPWRGWDSLERKLQPVSKYFADAFQQLTADSSPCTQYVTLVNSEFTGKMESLSSELLLLFEHRRRFKMDPEKHDNFNEQCAISCSIIVSLYETIIVANGCINQLQSSLRIKKDRLKLRIEAYNQLRAYVEEVEKELGEVTSQLNAWRELDVYETAINSKLILQNPSVSSTKSEFDHEEEPLLEESVGSEVSTNCLLNTESDTLPPSNAGYPQNILSESTLISDISVLFVAMLCGFAIGVATQGSILPLVEEALIKIVAPPELRYLCEK